MFWTFVVTKQKCKGKQKAMVEDKNQMTYILWNICDIKKQKFLIQRTAVGVGDMESLLYLCDGSMSVVHSVQCRSSVFTVIR